MAAKKRSKSKKRAPAKASPAPPPTSRPRRGFPDASRTRARGTKLAKAAPPPPAQPAPKIGRPTIRTPEIVRHLLEWTANSGTLRAFCRLPGMPSHETVYDWFEKDDELEKAFDKARLLGGRQLAEEILEIADTPHAGEIVIEESVTLDDGDGGEVPATKRTVRTEDMLGHRKLQIDARERLLKLWFPEWFAKKVDVDHKSGGKSFDALLRSVLGDDKEEPGAAEP